MARKGKGKGRKVAQRDSFGLDPTNPTAGFAQGPGLGVVYDLLKHMGFDSVGTFFARGRTLDSAQLAALYTHGLAKRIADLLPAEAMAAGYALDPGVVTPGMELAARRAGYADFEAATKAEAALARNLQVDRCLVETWQRARVYGEALGVVGYAPDGKPPYSKPAPYGRKILWLQTWDRREYQPDGWVTDPGSARYRKPRVFEIHTTKATNYRDPGMSGPGKVHYTRTIRLQTDDGRSIYQRGAEELAAFLTGAGAAAGTLSKAGGLIWEQADWDAMIDQDEAEARKVIDMNLRAWSRDNFLILPKGQASVSSPMSGSLAGVDATLNALAWVVCGIWGVPMSKLFGLMPTGFASDENSRLNWELALASGREYIEGAILELRRHTWAQVLGGQWPEELSVKWNPIKAQTTLERAEAITKMAEALTAVQGLGVMSQAGLAAALASLPEAEGLEIEAPEVPAGVEGASGPLEADAELDVPEGTFLAAPEIESKLGVAARKITSLGKRRKIGRRMVGGRWEYRLEDVHRYIKAAVQEPEA